VISGVYRHSKLIEPIIEDIDIHYGVMTENVVEAYRNTLAFRDLSTAIFANTGAEGILRKAQQLPVAKSPKYTVPGVYVLVRAGYVFIHVSASTGRLEEIVYCSGARGARNVGVE